MSMLKLQILGNLGGDAVIREYGVDQRVIVFSVAHSEKYKDSQGVVNERTTWVECSLFRKSGSTGIAEYLKKGKTVYVEGVPSARSYTKHDGSTAVTLDLKVSEIELA